MIRKRFCEILQNLHFADNSKVDKTDKAFKIRPVIDHLSSKFPEVLSNDSEQSIDEHMVNTWWTHGEIQRQIWNKAEHKIKTDKMGFQFLILLFE